MTHPTPRPAGRATDSRTGRRAAVRPGSKAEIKHGPGWARSESTREALLDAAEKLFAERGVAATSIRDIIGAAGVNLGAINYHFGTKKALVLAVFSRRLSPVSGRQFELLNRVEQDAGGRPPRLEAVLEAMIRPPIERSFTAGKRDTAFMRLVGRFYGEPDPEIERRVRSELKKVWSRFAALLARALPGLAPEEMYWRIRFMVGAIHHTLLTMGREGSLPGPSHQKIDAETLIRRLVAFASAGMREGT